MKLLFKVHPPFYHSRYFCHSRGGGNPGLVIKEIKYKKNRDKKIYYFTGFPLSRE